MIFRPTTTMPTERVNALRKMLGSEEGQDLMRLFHANAQKKWEEVLKEINESEGRGNVPDDKAFSMLVEDAKFLTAVVGALDSLAGETGELEYIIHNDNA